MTPLVSWPWVVPPGAAASPAPPFPHCRLCQCHGLLLLVVSRHGKLWPVGSRLGSGAWPARCSWGCAIRGAAQHLVLRVTWARWVLEAASWSPAPRTGPGPCSRGCFPSATRAPQSLGSAGSRGDSVPALCSRTAVNAQTGVCTPAGGLVTGRAAPPTPPAPVPAPSLGDPPVLGAPWFRRCRPPAGALVLLSLAYLTSLFYYIPKAALAAVIISAVVPMFDAGIFRTLWRVKSEGTSGAAVPQLSLRAPTLPGPVRDGKRGLARTPEIPSPSLFWGVAHPAPLAWGFCLC